MTLLLAAIAALALLEVAASTVLRPQTGPLALAAAFEPYLLAIGAVCGVLAVLRTLADTSPRASWIKLLGLVVLVVALVRLGGEWWSPGADPAARDPEAQRLVALTWNLEAGSKEADVIVDALLGDDGAGRPDLVGLQELTPAIATAIEADPRIDRAYPYRIMEPRSGDRGLGLLSSLPLVTGSSAEAPLRLTAGLLTDTGAVEVVVTHPFPPTVQTLDIGDVLTDVPWGLDARARDAALEVLRETVDAAPDPARVIVLGDLATTPFEPGFPVIAAGLHDAHADVGSGTGFTWRPDELEFLDAGLLRIDHFLTGAAVTPVTSIVDCSAGGDHCRLTVTLDVGTLVTPPGGFSPEPG